MDAYRIITKKRDGESLSLEELEFFTRGFSDGSIADYQMSAFLMSVFLNGMTTEETVNLTKAMMGTGKVLDLSEIQGAKVDKHSTGGVGDKVSLVLAPLVAAAGVRVPMVSGRTLGHTGGTLDKLESIPGFRTLLSAEDFVRNVETVGFAIAAQSSEFVPADAGMYALRGVTGTVESIPLIVSSILSKKFAAGIDCIVFDVKCGGGAFMSDFLRAQELAKELVHVCSLMGKTGKALITDMSQPLGRAVGNALEVEETIQCLSGGGPGDLREITLELGAEMLLLSGMEDDEAGAKRRLVELLDGGGALEAFARFVEAQGGDSGIVDDPSLLPKASRVETVTSEEEGYVSSIDARALGELCVDMGGGRRRRDDEIDKSVGLLLHAKVGDKVSKGSPLCDVHASSEIAGAGDRVLGAFRIGDGPLGKRKLILEQVPAQT